MDAPTNPAAVRPANPGVIRRSLTSAAGSRRVLAGIALLAAMMFAAIALVASSRRLNLEVAQALATQALAYRAYIAVQAAETGQRGYVLTRDAFFLRRYWAGRDRLPAILTDLRVAATRNDTTLREIASFEGGISAKMAELASTIADGRAGAWDRALARVRTRQGDFLMSGIRESMIRIEAAEAARVAERTADARIVEILAVAFTFVSGLLVVFVGVSALDAFRRDRATIEGAGRLLRAANATLEARVALRTADLTAANDEIQRFAYIVSHDLRSPLVNVMGFTSELETAHAAVTKLLERVEADAPALATTDVRLAVREDMPEAIGFIRASTGRMERLIAAILKLAREGHRVLVPEPLALNAIVDEAVSALAHQLDERDAEVAVGALPALVADRLAVEQIVGNLIENAVKYGAPGRPNRIRVEGEAAADRVTLRVSDTGRGIDSADLERIFDLFRRAGMQDRAGEGIGLAHVRALTRRLDGSISVVSTPGVGSTFTVSLPARPENSTQREAGWGPSP